MTKPSRLIPDVLVPSWAFPARPIVLSVLLACAPFTASVSPSAAQTAPAPAEEQPAATPPERVSPAPTATPPVAEAQTDAAQPKTVDLRLPHDLSPWSMFLAADVIVKGVMLGLLFASLVTWTILFGKTIELGLARRRLKAALTRMETATTFSEARIGSGTGLLSNLVDVAAHEMNLAPYAAQEDGVKERCASHFSEIVRANVQAMRRGMGILATIGSTAPFVGLFGTVWGIMNAFIGISKAQTTNLAVVAPGIAEALLATAIGLVAAIPAVIVYNHFSQATRRYQFLVNRAAGTVQRLLSRELERRHAGSGIRAAE